MITIATLIATTIAITIANITDPDPGGGRERLTT